MMAVIVLSGCAGQPAILEQSSFWPFNRIRLQTASVGPLTAYFHHAPQAIRAVVIVQAPPCTGEGSQPGATALSTGGILWDELKRDSLLLQLEQPGMLRGQPQPTASDCKAVLRTNMTVRTWSRAVKEVLAAIQRQEGTRLPTVYIGVGSGALPATRLAATDPNATRLLLVNGTGLHPAFERLLATLQSSPPAQPAVDPTRSAATLRPMHSSGRSLEPVDLADLGRVSTLLVHGNANRESPIESALLLFSQLTSGSASASMVVVNGQGADFGLSSEPQCFEKVMQLIASGVREATPSALTQLDCALVASQPLD
jgi:hypothetical protein